MHRTLSSCPLAVSGGAVATSTTGSKRGARSDGRRDRHARGGSRVIIVDPVATQEACELTAADITWDLAPADAPESAFDECS